MNIRSCKEAKSQGATRYFTGEECPQGHISERIVSTRACVDCASEKKKLWSKNNPEKVNAQKRAYRNANLDIVKGWQSANQKKHRAKANERTRRYYHANHDLCTERNRAWAKENPEKGAAKQSRRRSSKLLRTPLWANHGKIDRAYELAQEYRDKGIDCEVDHIIPLQGDLVSGLHVHNNLQILSVTANRSKSNKYIGGL